MTEELSRAKFTDDSFQPIVTAFERLSVAGLANQWQNSKQFFHTSSILLRAFGEGLPEDGAPISKDDLTNLQNTIVELRDEVRESDLPGRVKIFVYEQIETIARAIHDYPLAGVKAFRAAVRDVVFREAEHMEVVESYLSTPVMTRLKTVIQKLGELSKYVI